MNRCLELAQMGSPNTHPNPLVGSVVVHNNVIIGEGYHMAYGKPHAEVNAIQSVQDKSLLKESTLYVNLEPCSHFGKTPPCADLIVKQQLKCVVVANLDPHDKVAGKGVKRLQEAGIEVITGVLAEKGEQLNKAFFTLHRKKRPYVILKWAQTSNGFIGRMPNDVTSSKQISGPIAQQFTHGLRAESGAILIGTNTAIADNPSLTTRNRMGRNPIRVVLDQHGRIPASHALFTDQNDTCVFGETRHDVASENVVFYPYSNIEGVLKILAQNNITQVLVEGGASILNTFLTDAVWDEAYQITAPLEWDSGIEAPNITLEAVETQSLGEDSLKIYRNG